MSERARVNVTTADLDVLRRLADAKREVGEVADTLFRMRTSSRRDRENLGRRLNAAKASLTTVEKLLADEEVEP
jgi:hypothetical protein